MLLKVVRLQIKTHNKTLLNTAVVNDKHISIRIREVTEMIVSLLTYR